MTVLHTPISETTVPQAVSSTASAATVLSLMRLYSGIWYPVWWAVIVLVGSGWMGG